MPAKVTITRRRLEAFQKRITLDGANDPHIDTMYKRWAAIYKSFAQRRFVRLSRGGGEWAPIKPRRRDLAAYKAKRKSKRPVKQATLSKISAILRDTSTLFTVLDPTTMRAGALYIRNLRSVIVGYGGSDPHPSSGRVTIAQIAEFHQIGAGHLPVREIIVGPDSATIAQMQRETNRAADAIIKEISQIADINAIKIV